MDLPPEISCLVCRQGRPAFDSEVFLLPGRPAAVLRCPACRSYYIAPPITDAEIAACYSAEYHGGFSETLNKNFIKGALMGQRLKKWRAGGRFLDVGCALGGIVAGVAHTSGWQCVGNEITPETVASAKKLFPNVEFHQGTIENLPLGTPSFDLIYVNNVLEHVRDPEKFLGEIFKNLKSGGRMELAVPNGPVDINFNRLIYRREKTALLTKHGGHLFFLSRKGLKELLARAGFTVVSWKAFHFVQAVKTTGLVPGKVEQFRRKHMAKPRGGHSHAPVSEEIKFDAPGASQIAVSGLADSFRRPFRYLLPYGYDFEIVAEKPEGR